MRDIKRIERAGMLPARFANSRKGGRQVLRTLTLHARSAL
jgi:hypothetical protein